MNEDYVKLDQVRINGTVKGMNRKTTEKHSKVEAAGAVLATYCVHTEVNNNCK